MYSKTIEQVLYSSYEAEELADAREYHNKLSKELLSQHKKKLLKRVGTGAAIGGAAGGGLGVMIARKKGKSKLKYGLIGAAIGATAGGGAGYGYHTYEGNRLKKRLNDDWKDEKSQIHKRVEKHKAEDEQWEQERQLKRKREKIEDEIDDLKYDYKKAKSESQKSSILSKIKDLRKQLSSLK